MPLYNLIDKPMEWLGFTPEYKDVESNNKKVALGYDNAQLSVGSSVDVLTGEAVNNKTPVTYDNLEYNSNIGNEWAELNSDMLKYSQNINTYKNLSSEQQNQFIKRFDDLYKVYIDSKLTGDDAVANFKMGGDINARYDSQGALLRALEETTIEFGGTQKEVMDSITQDMTLKTDEVKNESPVSNTTETINVLKDSPKITTNDYLGYLGRNIAENELANIKENKNNYSVKSLEDGRVSLNVAPLDNLDNIYVTKDEFNARIGYVLGTNGGLLYDLYKNTAGLVFPYTPSITFNQTVDYDKMEINHSNLTIQSYKNTQVPTLSLTADFTADTEENAKYMVGTIWFLRACSKMDFGEKASNPGMPPPVLYLNGWGALINNIPVVISTFDVKLPADKHYVNVKVGGVSQYVPTKMTFSITLAIQPNIERYKKQFSLKAYKAGILGGMDDFDIDTTDWKNVDFDAFDRDSLGNTYITESFKFTNTGKANGLNIEKGYKAVRGSGAGWTW